MPLSARYAILRSFAGFDTRLYILDLAPRKIQNLRSIASTLYSLLPFPHSNQLIRAAIA
jgi:hypothetical protein